MCALVTYERNGEIKKEFLTSVFVTSRGVLLGYTVPDDFPVLVDPEELIEIEERERFSLSM